MRILFVLFLGLFAAGAEAADLESIFESLKQSAVNYEPDGAVCEQVARLHFQKQFPAETFVISGGVEYDIGGDTLGELDVIVLQKNSHKVILVAEVKCWKNLKQALEKVKDQRQRFVWNLQKHPGQMKFTTYDGLNLQVNQFVGVKNFQSVAQQGGQSRGFDLELDLTLDELRELRMRLLKCQAWGDCARPE